MSYLNLDFFLNTVLPKLLTMTLVSFVIGSVTGAVIGWIVKLIGRRRQRDQDSIQPKRWVLTAAMFGSFIGMLLIGMLPIQASPASLIGGPYSGIWLMMMVILLAPTGSILGAVVGAVLGAQLPARINPLKLAAIVTLVSYLICIVALYLGLAPPPVTISPSQTNSPFPVVAQIQGYESFPNDIALSDNGQQLAIANVRYGETRVEVLDLSARRVVHRLKPDYAFGLAFNQDSQELVTVRFHDTVVQTLSTGAVRLRLDGEGVVYPMAGNKLVTLAVVDPWKAKPDTKLDPSSFKVWDLTTGKLLQTIPADLSKVDQANLPIAVSPDRKLLAFPPTLYSNQIQVWDITTGKQVSALINQTPAGILALTFSPDGQQLAVALGQGPSLSVWDWQEAKLFKTIADAERAEKLYWPNPGIFVDSEGGFQVWDPQTGTHLQALDLKPEAPLQSSGAGFKLPSFSRSALSADRTTLAAASHKQGIWVWRVDQN
ncbi:WD40 repeat domain-containing protein [Lyngbya confervoides]|uniref:WD40 repeat domain-containing protein n=1 Tax=Lyngbya confervoides BDU141951 TaxID=1574623 RepID=A0ABD4T3C6_9CYAN|nr:WD40 repeat domain-containing protein [Lyngbya confervoides]MCM1982973.1 WD40 repeat domain-containing protein [Lyngbya confervoides BDU141951]